MTNKLLKSWSLYARCPHTQETPLQLASWYLQQTYIRSSPGALKRPLSKRHSKPVFYSNIIWFDLYDSWHTDCPMAEKLTCQGEQAVLHLQLLHPAHMVITLIKCHTFLIPIWHRRVFPSASRQSPLFPEPKKSVAFSLSNYCPVASTSSWWKAF